MFLLILTTLLTVFTVCLGFFELKRQITKQRFKHIPTVAELPVVGCDYVFKNIKIEEIESFFKEFHPAPVSMAYIFHKPLFMISDPIVLQQILTGNNFSEHPYLIDFSRLPYGIITARYNEWKPVRKAASPAFSHRMVTSFIPIFQKHFLRYCDKLESHLGGDCFDVNQYSLQTNMKIIMETNFEQEHKPGDENAVEHEVFEEFLDNISERICSPILHLDQVYQFSQMAKRDQILTNKLYNSFRQILKNHEKSTTDKATKTMDKPIWKRLFIDEMINYCKTKGNDRVLLENMMTIFVAGYDTTSLAVSNIILMLAIHPEVDQKLEKELIQNYKPGDEIDQELFKRLPYLECIVKEVLRLFPSAPLTARSNMEDVTVDKVGFVEKGTIFAINYYTLHRWTHVWGEDADQFKPDRFLPENSLNRHPYAFLPFGSGPRTCLGQQYAMYSIKTGLINILSRYRFTTILKMEDLQFKLSATLKLVTRHMVQVHKRHT